MRRLALVWIAAITLTVAEGKPHVWQDGHITSHRTLAAVGHSPNRQHLYGITFGGQRYMFILDRPLQVTVNDGVKFSPTRKHVLILDSDGQQRKGALLEMISIAGARR